MEVVDEGGMFRGGVRYGMRRRIDDRTRGRKSARECGSAMGRRRRVRDGDKKERVVELTGRCEDLETTMRVSFAFLDGAKSVAKGTGRRRQQTYPSTRIS